MIIFLHKTNQHQKYDIFHVENFSQNSKLTLDRAHRARRTPVDQDTHRVCRALDARRASFLATHPVLKITYQVAHRALHLAPLLAPTPFKFVHIFGKGVGARSGAKRRAFFIGYPEHGERR